jgi:copper chaperone NosL
VRTLAAFGVLLAAVVAGVFLWPAPSGPEPIAYGRDVCAHCRMHLGRPGFAGELRDTHGTLEKFDDVGCLLHALLTTHVETPEAWVEDHAGDGFVPLVSAYLVRSQRVGTPMGYGVVAFRTEAAARDFAAANQGDVVRLETLLQPPDVRGEQVAP